MNVLAIDTSNEPGSVALAREGDTLEVVALAAGWHSTTLHLEIARLLGRHGLTSRDIQGYGVTTGPGSFTGVRVGLAAVKGMAEVHGKPIVPVSTLLTMAAAAQPDSRIPSPDALVVILDARRGQIFGGVYREENGWWRALVEECVCALRSFLERLRAPLEEGAIRNPAFCGKDPAPFLGEMEAAGWGGAAVIPVPAPLAGALARIATRRLEQGLGVAAADAEANYVRLSDAELFWKE